MKRDEMLEELKVLRAGLEDLESDLEVALEEANAEADRLLGEYLGDPELVEAFDAIKRWYS